MSVQADTAAPRCAACGAGGLELRYRVAGDAGPAGLVPTTDRFGTALSDIVRCRTCGHLQLEQLPAEELLYEGYSDAWSADYLKEEAGQRATARAALQLISRYSRSGRLLDVGCWLGFLLDEARRAGWRPTGLEPSRQAGAFAREQLGLDVRCSGLFDVELPAATFDAAVLGDVLEHFPDPAAALERVQQLLRPRGILFLALPDAGSRVARLLGPRWWSVIPTHVHYFTRRSLTTLLHRGGWQLLALRTAPKAFTVRYYVERLGGYSPPLARGLAALAKRAGVADRLVWPDFRDRMAVVAQAPA